jgi:HPt (histidine-containing phosphotransfer) domain-containing protein
MAGKETVTSVYEEFENEAIDQIKESLEAWKTKDLQIIKNHWHTLKGNAGTIGLAKLHEKIKSLELKVKIDDFSSFDREMPQIEQEFEVFQHKYKGFLKEM